MSFLDMRSSFLGENLLILERLVLSRGKDGKSIFARMRIHFSHFPRTEKVENVSSE